MSKPKFPPRNPIPKPFTAIVPPSLKAASETYQFSPAVRIGDQILISGIVGVDAEGRLPPDFRSQAENVFRTLEAILNEAGATLDNVASLNSYHVGDIHSQLRELVDIKATRIQAPHPIWTGVGVTQLGVPGALLEISAVAVARDGGEIPTHTRVAGGVRPAIPDREALERAVPVVMDLV